VNALGTSLVTSLSLLAAGCESVEDCSLTYHVWNGNMSHRWVSAPTPDPQLALFEAPSDILVQYNSLSDRSGNVKRQAYFLQENQPRILNGKKPRYIDPMLANDMKPIEVAKASAEDITGTNTSPTVAIAQPVSDLHAVLMPDHQHFKLIEGTDRVETYQLPIYVETGSKTLQIIATPFAVAGDTVMVAAFIAAIGALAWLECGAPH
jgi:hypothetical protein